VNEYLESCSNDNSNGFQYSNRSESPELVSIESCVGRSTPPLSTGNRLFNNSPISQLSEVEKHVKLLNWKVRYQ
jgi:hypothetical protein